MNITLKWQVKQQGEEGEWRWLPWWLSGEDKIKLSLQWEMDGFCGWMTGYIWAGSHLIQTLAGAGPGGVTLSYEWTRMMVLQISKYPLFHWLLAIFIPLFSWKRWLLMHQKHPLFRKNTDISLVKILTISWISWYTHDKYSNTFYLDTPWK